MPRKTTRPTGRPRSQHPKKAPEPSTKPRDEFPPTEDHVRVEARRTAVAKLLERGIVTQRELVAALAVQGFKASQATVSKDITAIREEWAQLRAHNFELSRDFVRAGVLATLREAYLGWEASRRDQVTTKTGPVGRGKSRALATMSVETKTGPGNPEFLSRMQAAFEQLCRIDGLHSKIKFDVSSEEGLAVLAAMAGVDVADLPERPGAPPPSSSSPAKT